MTTKVHSAKILPQEGCSVIRLNCSSRTSGPRSQRNMVNVLYTFRGFSSTPLEPFVCIARDDNAQQVFAYADDYEFLIEHIDGDDETVLREILTRASRKGMRSLARFADLIGRAVKGVAAS